MAVPSDLHEESVPGPAVSRAAALLAAAAAVAAVPATAQAALDLTHGERFGTAPNEIVDLSSNGQFLVATQGRQVVRYDLPDLDNPRRRRSRRARRS